MSEGLLTELNAYEVRYNNLRPVYTNLLLQLRNHRQNLANLMSNPPQYRIDFNANADGTARISPSLTNDSGLSQLEAAREMCENIRAVRIESGQISYNDVNGIISSLDSMIATRRNAITSVEATIANVTAQLTNIVLQLKMESNFSPENWIELNQFFLFDTFQEDSIIVTDIMTDAEIQDVQQELFDLGNRVLQRCSYPKYTIEIDSVNFFALKEYQFFTNQCELGTTFTLDLERFMVKPLLLEIYINFDDPTDFKLTFANKTMLDDGFSLLDFAGSNVNATNSISFDLVKLEAMKRQNNAVTEFINGSLDATLNNIKSSKDHAAITIDGTGVRARSYEYGSGRLQPYESWWTGKTLAFSDDNFQSAKAIFGLINFPSGNGRGYGICNENNTGQKVKGVYF
jgi:hypothetical protein